MSKIEYELRVLEINREEIIQKLEKMGAKKVKDVHMKRYVYDFNPVEKHRYIRVRTDGITTTLTIKHVQKDTIDGTQELEIEVGDFEKTNEILNQLGYKPKGFQESYRLEYELEGVIFDIDRWPFIPEFMEIEGSSSKEVIDMVERLELPKDSVIASGAYEHYGIDSTQLENLSFDMEKETNKNM